MSDDELIAVSTPELQLHCDSPSCNGIRLFERNQFPMMYEYVELEGGNDTSYEYAYIEYLCQNCKQNIKSYALMIIKIHDNEKDADIIKIGEYPFYGPTIPSKLISLIGPDRELFLKGRKCESQNFGIAAYSYYRRVVENQKDRLIDNILKVMHTLNYDKNIIDRLNEIKKDTQFKNVVDGFKQYFPKQLLIENQNPLQLLYKALSIGIHNLSDEECLTNAHSIRVVLTELAKRIKEITDDKKELKDAIKNLNDL